MTFKMKYNHNHDLIWLVKNLHRCLEEQSELINLTKKRMQL